MLNAMTIHERLLAWHARRRFSGDRSGYLDAPVYWRWPGMAWDDAHGTPLFGLPLDRLTPAGMGGRPRKEFSET
jgi:hypothetical protein